jgi:hypothetical protein
MWYLATQFTEIPRIGQVFVVWKPVSIISRRYWQVELSVLKLFKNSVPQSYHVRSSEGYLWIYNRRNLSEQLIISFTRLKLIKFEERSRPFFFFFLSTTHNIIYGVSFSILILWCYNRCDGVTARARLFLSADSGTVTPHTNKFTAVEAILPQTQLPMRQTSHAGVLTSVQSTSQQTARPWKMLNIISECQKIFLPRTSVWLWRNMHWFWARRRYSPYAPPALICYSSCMQIFAPFCSGWPLRARLFHAIQ